MSSELNIYPFHIEFYVKKERIVESVPTELLAASLINCLWESDSHSVIIYPKQELPIFGSSSLRNQCNYFDSSKSIKKDNAPYKFFVCNSKEEIEYSTLVGSLYACYNEENKANIDETYFIKIV